MFRRVVVDWAGNCCSLRRNGPSGLAQNGLCCGLMLTIGRLNGTNAMDLSNINVIRITDWRCCKKYCGRNNLNLVLFAFWQTTARRQRNPARCQRAIFFYMANVKKKIKRCDNCANWRRSFGSFGICPYMEFEMYCSNSCDNWIGRKVERNR